MAHTAHVLGNEIAKAHRVRVLHSRRLANDVAEVTTWHAWWSWRLCDGMLLLAGAGALIGSGLWALSTR